MSRYCIKVMRKGLKSIAEAKIEKVTYIMYDLELNVSVSANLSDGASFLRDLRF